MMRSHSTSPDAALSSIKREHLFVWMVLMYFEINKFCDGGGNVEMIFFMELKVLQVNPVFNPMFNQFWQITWCHYY